MRKLFLFFVLGFTLLSSALAETARPEVSRYIKAYTGGEGIVVWVLRVGLRESQEALVQINGIDHNWDGRIQKMKVEPTQTGFKYAVTRDGKRIDVLVADANNLELLVTGTRWTAKLGYDKALSAQGSPGAFLTAYLDEK